MSLPVFEFSFSIAVIVSASWRASDGLTFKQWPMRGTVQLRTARGNTKRRGWPQIKTAGSVTGVSACFRRDAPSERSLLTILSAQVREMARRYIRTTDMPGLAPSPLAPCVSCREPYPYFILTSVGVHS
ncbi:hypothetical protein BDW22DRAFT_28468 [Trametopsis cervina]|nr:hypothetical protein BDW22DRAFT_28468 [Trametopsis cervina]